MKTFKYIDSTSPVEMTIGMYEMLNREDALETFDRINLLAHQKRVGANTFDELIRNNESVVCPVDATHKIVKNGKDRNQKQRYKCLDCGKTFSVTSQTLSSNTSQSIGKWVEFILGLFNALSCEQLSEKCKISTTTAWQWRLKIFEAIDDIQNNVQLSGVVFADDTRVPYNFKGNHGDEFIAPRQSRKRGNQNTINNCHKNTICVLCSLDSKGNSFSRCIGFGNPSGKRLSDGFINKLSVDESTVLVTDGAQSFSRVVQDYAIPKWEKRITITKNGKKYPNMLGQFHIQQINGYHSRLKNYLRPFKSVASRYLPGYLLVFDYMENNKELTKKQMALKILNHMAQLPSTLTIKQLEAKYKIPVSNNPEEELWELKVPSKEQKIYIDWVNKVPLKEICSKHNINKRKVYTIKEKVEKYNLHEAIITKQTSPKKRSNYSLPPINDKHWDIFLKCYRDGISYAELGRMYGVSRQRIHQIVIKMAKRPEAMAIKCFKDCFDSSKSIKKLKKDKKDINNSLYRDFNIMFSEETTIKDVCTILAKKYNLSYRGVEGRIFRQRQKENNILSEYVWKEDRQLMSQSDYYTYLKEKHQQLYNDIIEKKSKQPDKKLKDIFLELKESYNYSFSRIESIYYKQKHNITVSHPNTLSRNRTPYKRARQPEIYEAVIMAKNENPHLTLPKIFQIISHDKKLAKETVKKYYYYHCAFMRQEQEQE